MRLRYLAPGLLGACFYLALLATDELGPAARPLQFGLLVLLGLAIVSLPEPWRSVQAWLRARQLPELLAITAISGLALGLRVWGIGFGLPYIESSDEWAVADRALAMLRTAEYNPGSFIYPTLYTYLQLGVAIVHFLAGVSSGVYRSLADLDPARFYVWGRTLTALLGTGAVVLTFLLGRRLYGAAVGLLAALFLALSPAHVEQSHLITTDVPASFFTMLALLAISHLALDPPRRRADDLALALLSGMAVGLASGTKYNAAVLLLPLLLALLLRRAGGSALLVASAGLALGFTLATPYWLAALPQFLSDLASVVVHYKFDGHPGVESQQAWLHFARRSADDALLLAWLGLAGVLLMLLRRRPADLLVLAFVLPYYAQLSALIVVFFRNMMPLLPLLSLAAAVALSEGLRVLLAWLQRSRFAASFAAQRRRVVPLLLSALLLLLLAAPTRDIVQRNSRLAAPTTRLEATAWVLEQVPPGARIWLEDQTLILPAGRYRVLGGTPVGQQSLAAYREQGFKLLVVNWTRSSEAQRAALAGFGEPVARFERGPQQLGESFLIFDTGLADPAAEERTALGSELASGAIVLDGFRHPARAQAGQTLPLALYWRANWPPAADFWVFVHLVDREGRIVAQRDLPPLEGSRPTSSWLAGELLRDDQDLPVPAEVQPGSYRLLVGMYDPQTLQQVNSAPIDLGLVEVSAGDQ